MRPRWFAHVDMDAFYASVEVLDRPELAGLPIAVGGPSDRRGVIAAASYASRQFGVHSAMPTAQAFRLCPDLVLLPGRMERYQEKSREVMGILKSVAPKVEPLSLDEAFLDLTGCERLHGNWSQLAQRVRMSIYEQTGLWASVGMGETRRIAKIAGGLRKPRGLVVVDRGAGPDFLAALPVARLWGVGPKLRQRLEQLGLLTVADIARTPRAQLQSMLGKTGLALHDMVHARESGNVNPGRAHRSVSHEVTFGHDRVGHDQIEPVLLHLCEKVGGRLRNGGLCGRVVQLKIRDTGFHTFTRRTTLPRPTDTESDIYRAVRHLLHDMKWEQVPVRLVGVGVSQFSKSTARQGDLFASRTERSQPVIDQTLDKVHDKYGGSSIGRARSLLRKLSGDSASWQEQLWSPLDRNPGDQSTSIPASTEHTRRPT